MVIDFCFNRSCVKGVIEKSNLLVKKFCANFVWAEVAGKAALKVGTVDKVVEAGRIDLTLGQLPFISPGVV